MERLITQKIKVWSESDEYLPLFILGARQIGKTFTVLDFAKKYYKDKYIYINFLDKDQYYQYLNNETNPEKIIKIIEGISRQSTKGGLLIFDEIQEMPSLKTSLKLFV